MPPWAVAHVAHIKSHIRLSEEIIDGVRVLDSLLDICILAHVTVTLPGNINHQPSVNTAVVGGGL